MARQVTIATGKHNVQLPNGNMYDAGDVVILSDEQFEALNQSLIPGTVIDNGVVEGVEDQVVTQGANVTAPAALTTTAPAALTSSAPAALTSTAPSALTAVATVGAAPTDDEHDALLADVTALHATVTAMRADDVALRTTLAATQADVAALRGKVASLVTDLTALRTTVAALETALSGSGKALSN